MYRVLALAILLLLLMSGCSVKDPVKQPANAKAFEREDEFIMYALVAEQQGQPRVASDMYMKLFAQSDKREYLYRSLQIDNKTGSYERVLERTGVFIGMYPEDAMLKRHEIIALLGKERNEEAKAKALTLVETTKVAEDYLIVSEIYIQEKHYDTALKYLERAYAIDYDEKILDKMSIILYVNLARKSDAIAHLETHSRLHGCSEIICNRLAAFYSEQNDLPGMLSTYSRLYAMDPAKKEYAEAIIKIYSYQKDYLRLRTFLEESGADDRILLQLYINDKSFDKAAPLAKSLYEREGEIEFLGQYAIFSYEAAPDKNDQVMLDEVIRAFKKVLNELEDPLYYNYLGYLLIDHDMDIKQGMAYVREALKSEPESPYYKDSLGWGYYKLGNCKKAYQLIHEVQTTLGKEDKEVQTHMKAIHKCLKRKKK
jgi:tetratricopeptide (TPR) repeat protein